jgi:lysyl-tRNA synthetase class 2
MTAPATEWKPVADVGTLRRRAGALAVTREFFAARNVLECETPVLVGHPVSDARLRNIRCQLAVRPGIPYYLHTSPEYHMKRLLAAGFPDIYQICKAFRDGELGARHLPEFTLIEWYRRKLSFEAIIAETCELVALIANGWGRRLPRPERISYGELFQDACSLDPLAASLDAVRERAAVLLPGGLPPELRDSIGDDRGAWLDLLMVQVIEPGLRERGLVVVDHYPASQAALARLHPTDTRVAERFEVYCDGLELANGYHELSDAAEQRRRFAADRAERARLGLPDTPPDPALLAALEEGLPDCCGVALGFDRLLMACGGFAHIGDVVTFPTPEDF